MMSKSSSKAFEYRFEWNDVRAMVTVVNVILILRFGVTISYLGLLVSILGMAKDFLVDRKLSGMLMHMANAMLYTYFLTNTQV